MGNNYPQMELGGPDGEMGASMRYLSQRFTAPNRTVMGVLTDVGTEELAHLEMVATIVHQLTCNLTPEEIEKILDERRHSWKPAEPRYKSGVLKIYSEHAVSPMKGGYME